MINMHPKCSTTSKGGDTCPNEATKKTGEDWLCEQCYETYLHIVDHRRSKRRRRISESILVDKDMRKLIFKNA